MKSILIWVAFVVLLAACNPKPVDETPPAAEPVSLPVELTYKGTPAMGDMKNTQMVLTFMKRISELNPDVGEFMADSVTVHFADGTEFTASRDSVVAEIGSWLGMMSGMKVSHTAAMAVDNTDAKHEWVFSWSDETYTYKDGTVQHEFLHEDYRIEQGKIVEVYQYSRKPPAEAAPN